MLIQSKLVFDDNRFPKATDLELPMEPWKERSASWLMRRARGKKEEGKLEETIEMLEEVAISYEVEEVSEIKVSSRLFTFLFVFSPAHPAFVPPDRPSFPFHHLSILRLFQLDSSHQIRSSHPNLFPQSYKLKDPSRNAPFHPPSPPHRSSPQTPTHLPPFETFPTLPRHGNQLLLIPPRSSRREVVDSPKSFLPLLLQATFGLMLLLPCLRRVRSTGMF